jgi:PKD repeat protein
MIAPLIAVGLSTVSKGGTIEPNLQAPRVDTIQIGSSDVDNTLWNRTYDASTTGNDDLQGTWVDSSGNVYTTGHTDLSGTSDVVLVKWSSAGNVIWNRTFNNGLYELGYGVWGNDAGLVFTCGSTSSPTNGSDFQLITWDATTGNPLRNLTHSVVDIQLANSVWGDGKGWVYLTGYNYVGGADYDFYSLKWSTTNTTIAWTSQWNSGHNQDVSNSITGDASGIIYTVGHANNGTGGAAHTIVAKMYANNGTRIWARQWGAPTMSLGYGIWYNGTSSLYITGMTLGGKHHLYLAKLQASSGAEIWNRTTTGSNEEEGKSIWVDGAGKIYTGGQSNRGYGVEPLLVKWNATGAQIWNRTLDPFVHTSGSIKGIWGHGTSVYTAGTFFGTSFEGFLTKWNCANSIPTIAFTADPNPCIPNYDIQFTYTGSTVDMIAFYEWDFGDGTPKSNLANPVHNYTSVGMYTIILKVLDVDVDGGTSTFFNGITIVNDLPVTASFTVNDTYPVDGQSVQFTHTGMSGNGPTSYYWEFGDGGENYQQNPIHVDTTVGNHTVTWYVDDIDDSASLTVIFCVFVFQDYEPSANFTINDTAIDDSEMLQFTFSGTAENGIDSYLWNFGDGVTSTDAAPTHKYVKPGTYTVTLTVVDPDGDTSAIQKVIVVGGLDEELVTTVVIVIAAIGAGAVLVGFVLIRKLKVKRNLIKAR